MLRLKKVKLRRVSVLNLRQIALDLLGSSRETLRIYTSDQGIYLWKLYIIPNWNNVCSRNLFVSSASLKRSACAAGQ